MREYTKVIDDQKRVFLDMIKFVFLTGAVSLLSIRIINDLLHILLETPWDLIFKMYSGYIDSDFELQNLRLWQVIFCLE